MAIVHEVLDARKCPIRISNQTGAYVVFEIVTMLT